MIAFLIVYYMLVLFGVLHLQVVGVPQRARTAVTVFLAVVPPFNFNTALMGLHYLLDKVVLILELLLAFIGATIIFVHRHMVIPALSVFMLLFRGETNE